MADLIKYQEAVRVIKNAILQSRYRAARLGNREQLLLYYGIGSYVSANTRSGKWGTGAIEEISRQLQIELPGLRGYSATNMKYMRIFFEEWVDLFGQNTRISNGKSIDALICHLASDELMDMAITGNRHLISDDSGISNVDAFLRVGFTHHREILAKCKSTEER